MASSPTREYFETHCWNCGLLNSDNERDCQHCEAPLPSLVFNEVLAERNRQDAKWGGPEHDDQHCAEDWNRFITRYSMWAAQMADMNSPDKYRRRMVQVAALAIAAIESLDRKIQPTGSAGERRAPHGPVYV